MMSGTGEIFISGVEKTPFLTPTPYVTLRNDYVTISVRNMAPVCSTDYPRQIPAIRLSAPIFPYICIRTYVFVIIIMSVNRKALKF